MSLRSASALLAVAASGCITAFQVTQEATLATNASAPPFALTAQDGSTVSLASALERGPVAIVFYRGFW